MCWEGWLQGSLRAVGKAWAARVAFESPNRGSVHSYCVVHGRASKMVRPGIGAIDLRVVVGFPLDTMHAGMRVPGAAGCGYGYTNQRMRGDGALG